MVKERRFEVPQFPHYFAWVDDPESLLSNQGLRRAIEKAAEPETKAELANVLAWSEKLRLRFGRTIENLRTAIKKLPYVLIHGLFLIRENR